MQAVILPRSVEIDFTMTVAYGYQDEGCSLEQQLTINSLIFKHNGIPFHWSVYGILNTEYNGVLLLCSWLFHLLWSGR